MTIEEQLQQQIVEQIDFTQEVSDEELKEVIYEELKRYSRVKYLSMEERVHLGQELFNAFRKLDLIQELLEQDEITEIMINGISNIFVEKAGQLWELERRFYSKAKLETVIQQIVSGTNRLVNESSPIADARLEDGSRVNIVLYPIALNGPIVTIRKFAKDSITMKNLVQWNTITQDAASFLEQLVISKYNIFISGGTGSGKTTFLNALSEFIPQEERIITIEDNAELQLKGIPNLVRLEARVANVEGEGEITIRDLIKSSLRMRPNRVVVGEVRGPEAIDMISVFNTGHDGSLSTAHSNSTKDMLSRLETMILMGMELPVAAIRRQIASAIDIMIHVGRLRDGSRKVMEISEVLGYENGEIQLQTLYKFQEIGEEDGKIKGILESVNGLVHRDKLVAAGYQDS